MRKGRHSRTPVTATPAVVRARVATWLLATGALAGQTAWRGSQEALARHLGLSRVTVNRALRRLTTAGAVAVTPRGLVLLDPAALKAVASGS